MGRALSRVFHSRNTLLSVGKLKNVSEETRNKIGIIFDALAANPLVTVQRLEGLLSEIPKNENILVVQDENGYNLLQKCVGFNNRDMVRWILLRNPDLNRGACSLPLHIACLKGYEELVIELLRRGGRMDVEARMCWPGQHSQKCEQRGRYLVHPVKPERPSIYSSDSLQNAIIYAITGDQVDIVELLMSGSEDPAFTRRPLLHVACQKAAWNCTKFLISERPHEINMQFDEYSPIHFAVLHDIKFLNLLMASHAETTIVTPTKQFNLLHFLFLFGHKSAEDTLHSCKVLLENGLSDMINFPDILGNTPLHALIMRCAIEESQFEFHHESQPWNKWDMLHLIRFMLHQGATHSINHPSNSAITCVLRHIKDWEVRYEILNMLMHDGGDPKMPGRDGSVPLMACLVPLINKDPLFNFNHTMKVCYLNCVRLLCEHGADPNCFTKSNLTPLHVLVFTVSENITLSRQAEKRKNFEFLKNLLVLLLQYGLDPNVEISEKTPHILLNIAEMVKNTRTPLDMEEIYDLILTLVQNGANPNVNLSDKEEARSYSYNMYLHKTFGYFLDYYAFLISRKEDILLDPDQRYAKIIFLFYYCMNHRDLFACLTNLCSQITSSVPSKGIQNLHNIIKDLNSKPRSLKQISRLAVYKCLRGKPSTLIAKLNLPTVLKDYITNFKD